MELLVARLRHGLVDDLQIGILGEPAGDVVAHRLAVPGERGGEDLHSGELHDGHERASALISRSSSCSSASVSVRLAVFARESMAFASGSSAGTSWRASQCFTLESPPMGPVAVCCSLPNSPPGAPA